MAAVPDENGNWIDPKTGGPATPTAADYAAAGMAMPSSAPSAPLGNNLPSAPTMSDVPTQFIQSTEGGSFVDARTGAPISATPTELASYYQNTLGYSPAAATKAAAPYVAQQVIFNPDTGLYDGTTPLGKQLALAVGTTQPNNAYGMDKALSNVADQLAQTFGSNYQIPAPALANMAAYAKNKATVGWSRSDTGQGIKGYGEGTLNANDGTSASPRLFQQLMQASGDPRLQQAYNDYAATPQGQAALAAGEKLANEKLASGTIDPLMFAPFAVGGLAMMGGLSGLGSLFSSGGAETGFAAEDLALGQAGSAAGSGGASTLASGLSPEQLAQNFANTEGALQQTIAPSQLSAIQGMNLGAPAINAATSLVDQIASKLTSAGINPASAAKAAVAIAASGAGGAGGSSASTGDPAIDNLLKAVGGVPGLISAGTGAISSIYQANAAKETAALQAANAKEAAGILSPAYTQAAKTMSDAQLASGKTLADAYGTAAQQGIAGQQQALGTVGTTLAGQTALQQPFITAGTNALNTLSTGLEKGGQFNTPFVTADMANVMPAFTFARDQALGAAQNSLLARGGGMSTQEEYNAATLAGNIGSQYEQQAFNQWLAQNNLTLQQLQNLVQTGQISTQALASELGAAGVNAETIQKTIGSLGAAGTLGAGTATANAGVNSANALASGIMGSAGANAAGVVGAGNTLAAGGLQAANIYGQGATNLANQVSQVGQNNTTLNTLQQILSGKYGTPNATPATGSNLSIPAPTANTAYYPNTGSNPNNSSVWSETGGGWVPPGVNSGAQPGWDTQQLQAIDQQTITDPNSLASYLGGWGA